MTTGQIEVLFHSVIEEKAIYKKLNDISEDKIYNWRKGRGAKPTIGDMLNVLYQLNLVNVVLNGVVKPMSNEWIPDSDYTHKFTIPTSAFGGDLDLPPKIEKKLIKSIKPNK
jgi:hypothetical protein